MAVNHFKMRQNVRTYNLSGMGCSASLLAVDLRRSVHLSAREQPRCDASSRHESSPSPLHLLHRRE